MTLGGWYAFGFKRLGLGLKHIEGIRVAGVSYALYQLPRSSY